jgi:NADH-quinone oxidoreductase subunit I
MFDLMSGVNKAFGGIYQIWRGLTTVGGHTLKVPTTGNYPEEPPHLPAHFRGRLALTVNPESGENLCISCRQCERVCPDKCIEITAHKSPETNKLELIDFKIDHGLCMFCGLCTEVCPTNCIINTNDFEMADYSRHALIYDLKKLTLSKQESEHYFASKEMPLPKPKPAKPAPGAAAAKPAAAAPAAGEAAKPEAKKVEPAKKLEAGAGEKTAKLEAAPSTEKPAEAPKPTPETKSSEKPEDKQDK